jgi:hypothetical protein
VRVSAGVCRDDGKAREKGSHGEEGQLTEISFDLPRSTFMARLSSGCSTLVRIASLNITKRNEEGRKPGVRK